MRIWPQCIPCIYAARAKEILASSLLDDDNVRSLTLLSAKLASANPYSSTVRLATETYRLVKLTTHTSDPYAEYKRMSNEYVREKLLPALKERVRGLSRWQLLRELLLASIATNALDPGVPGYEKIEVGLAVRLGRDEFEGVVRLLSSAHRVAYLLDNAGEAVVDLEVVKALRDMGLEVVAIAKSGAYQNDVTVDEAVEVGFGEVAQVVGSGSDAAGPLLGELSEEALELLTGADVVIAKGMANFEAFEEWQPPRPVVHVLKAKCLPVAVAVRVNVGEDVVMVRYQ